MVIRISDLLNVSAFLLIRLLRTNLKSSGVATKEDVSSIIANHEVVFYPEKDIKNSLKTASYQKVE